MHNQNNTKLWSNKNITIINKIIKLYIPMLYPYFNHYTKTTSTLCGGYAMPPLEYLLAVDVLCMNKEYIADTTLGLMDIQSGVIVLATKNRTIKEVVLTLMHELMHTIQYYNYEGMLQRVYNEQQRLNGYSNNALEIEARTVTWDLEAEWCIGIGDTFEQIFLSL